MRRNGVRTLTVRAFPDGGRLASQILTDVKEQINNLQLPQGYRIEYGGEDENQRETFGEMRTALAISLVLIFLILLLQFRTLSDALDRYGCLSFGLARSCARSCSSRITRSASPHL